jgi:hypothetical protein
MNVLIICTHWQKGMDLSRLRPGAYNYVETLITMEVDMLRSAKIAGPKNAEIINKLTVHVITYKTP